LFSSEVSFTQEMLLWEDGNQRRLDTRDGDADGDGGGTPDGDADDSEPETLAELASAFKQRDR
jgi:hypothetical protein